jgi:hypothetical protein
MLSLVAISFTAILYFIDRGVFQRFLGTFNPLVVFLAVSLLGLLLFYILRSRDWFTIYQGDNLKGLRYAAGVASILGVVIILADTRIVFSEDMNILFPKSLLFYPSMGFLVEVIFHLLPLTLLLVLFKAFFKGADFQTLTWVSILLVSLIEPVFQALDMVAQDRFPTWAVIFVGVHIFLISLAQLFFFKRYDFVTMYAFRLVYYLYWHIAWGHFRLELLF